MPLFTKWKTLAPRQDKRPSRFFVLLFILFALFLSIILSLDAHVRHVVADTPDFGEEFRATGRYDIIAKGVGTRGDPGTGVWTGSGDIDINIPATATIHEARLIWTGRSDLYDADGVIFGVDGGATTVIPADLSYKHEEAPWCCSGAAQRHESADITGLIQTGAHTYNISDHEHGYPMDPLHDYLNYGVGIWVVYEDASIDVGEVIVFEGQDSFFRNFVPPAGPHTNVRCADFSVSAQNRTVDIVHLISGVDLQSDPLRSDAFWFLTGSPLDTKPLPAETPGIIGTSIGYDPGGQYPLRSNAGLEWDNLETKGFAVAAGDTWACFQIESGDSQDLAGLGNAGTAASGMWNLFAIRVFGGTTAVDLVSFNGRSDTSRHVTLDWETSTEVDNYGFDLYRNDSDQFGSAEHIRFEPSTFTTGQTNYSFVDQVPTYGIWYYWLEDIDTEDNRALHGPVSIQVSRSNHFYLPFVQR